VIHVSLNLPEITVTVNVKCQQAGKTEMWRMNKSPGLIKKHTPNKVMYVGWRKAVKVYSINKLIKTKQKAEKATTIDPEHLKMIRG
jgi:hypothetical protein